MIAKNQMDISNKNIQNPNRIALGDEQDDDIVSESLDGGISGKAGTQPSRAIASRPSSAEFSQQSPLQAFNIVTKQRLDR